LIIQDKNKYNTPKFRLVVRFSRKDITCQIIQSDHDHDVVVASAYAHELKHHGVKCGFTNYAAAYSTGLLLARRVNKKFGLDELYHGKTEVDGEDYNVREEVTGESERDPFCAILDVGLKRTTTGSKVFGALKGACDGGLNVPHNDRRFPGSADKEEGKGVKNDKWEANPEKHREYIFGHPVAEYMRHLQDEDQDRFKKQFSGYIKAKIGPDQMEGMYKAAHASIRKNPDRVKKAKKEDVKKKRFSRKALSNEQRKARIRQKLTASGVKPINNPPPPKRFTF